MGRYILIEEMLTGSFSSKYLLILLRCYTAALNRIQKVFDSFKVSVILLTINVNDVYQKLKIG